MNKLLCIFLFTVLLSSTAEAIDKADVVKAIETDDISLQDCRKWYMVYKGAYIYVKELDAVGSKNFGDVFDRIRVVRDKIAPEKGNLALINVTEDFRKHFEEVDFTSENKTDFAEELFQICEGFKLSIEAK